MSNIKIVRSAKLICHFFLTNSDAPPADAGSRGGYTADFRPVMDILPRNRQEYGHPAKLPQRWSVYAHKKLALPLSAAAFAVRHRAGRQPAAGGTGRRTARTAGTAGIVLRPSGSIGGLLCSRRFFRWPPRPTASVNGRESSRCFWRIRPRPTRCLMCMCPRCRPKSSNAFPPALKLPTR